MHIPESVKEIGFGAFCSCYRLAGIHLPNGVTKVESRAFDSCESMAHIEPSDSLTRIEEAAFIGCDSLTSIRIPKSVTKIEGWFVAHCKQLSEIHFEHKGLLKSVKWNDEILKGVDKSQCTIFVPNGTKELYGAHPAFEGFRMMEE